MKKNQLGCKNGCIFLLIYHKHQNFTTFPQLSTNTPTKLPQCCTFLNSNHITAVPLLTEGPQETFMKISLHIKHGGAQLYIAVGT